MPYFFNTQPAAAATTNAHGQQIDTPDASMPGSPAHIESVLSTLPAQVISNEAPSVTGGVYYNARLDPKNFLTGPLSWNPATKLRQMLARPGIVVSTIF